MTKQYDVIIIGAGMGGLANALYLSEQGLKVLVCEQHITPGGYVCGFKRGRYYFDGANTGFSSHGIVFPVFKELGIDKRLKFHLHRITVAAPDVSLRFSYVDFDAFKTAISANFPEKNIEEFLSVLESFYNFYRILDTFDIPIIYSGFKAFSAYLGFSRLLFTKGIFKLISNVLKYSKYNNKEFVSLFFKPDSNAYRFFCNFGNPKQSSMIMAAMIHEFIGDKWYPEGGLQNLADTMTAMAIELGTEFKFNTMVNKIITENGKAVAIETEKGECFKANYIIAAGDYTHTMFSLLDDKTLLPVKLVEKIKNARYSESLYNLYIGARYTKQEIEERINGNHLFFYPELSEKVMAAEANNIDYFKNAPVSVLIPSSIDSSHAPQGCSSFVVQVLCPSLWMNNWGGGDQKEYKKLNEMVKNDVLANVKKIFPDLDERMEVIETGSPRTYERYTLNAGGAYCAWSWEPEFAFYNDINIHPESPVKNLFIGSHWSYNFGGFCSTLIAAKMIRRIITGKA